MTATDTLTGRYQAVAERVRRASAASGRHPDDVMLVAVTKFAEVDDIRALIELGHQDFGENRVQQLVQRKAMVDETLERARTLKGVSGSRRSLFDDGGASGPPDVVRWHMIGHLQRNKVAKVVPVARLIHSVDSLRLVEEMQSYAVKRDIDVECLVQVNCSGEASKAGCAVAAAQHLCEQIDMTGNLRIRGLMTMAPIVEDPADAAPTFERCAEVFSDVRRRGIGEAGFNILSMGMSNDFEVAIAHGSNMVRVGTAIFGSKPVEDDEAETP